LDRSLLFLILITIVIAITVFFFMTNLRTDPVKDAIQNNLMINIAIIVERAGRPWATELLMYYPGNARGALLDIPAETGLIIRSINRMDRIDALYNARNPKAYIDEIARLSGAVISWYLILDEHQLMDVVDLLEGVSMFIPNRVRVVEPENLALLPSGAVQLDGWKVLTYIRHDDPGRPEAEIVARRQALVTALIRRLGERKDFVFQKTVFRTFAERFRTDLSVKSLEYLLLELARLDTERMVQQRLTGTARLVEGVNLLFPHYDGELVKDIVKQTLNALLNAEAIAVSDKVFTVEVLNGTTIRGLAQRTADIFASFGYEVVSVGNAPAVDIASTMIVDRLGNPGAAETLANVIRCSIIEPGLAYPPTTVSADFVVILGRNFNGRYCVD
jgi:anionic cell wall polymer biosynthesis LytR-Cps2A-Psr (LCP) family protein